MMDQTHIGWTYWQQPQRNRYAFTIAYEEIDHKLSAQHAIRDIGFTK